MLISGFLFRNTIKEKWTDEDKLLVSEILYVYMKLSYMKDCDSDHEKDKVSLAFPASERGL